jgi:hypothetical protein
MSIVLSYSTLQNLGLKEGSSNAPLKESMGGTSAPYNAFTKMIPIDISRIPGIMENIFVGADCSPEEIQIYTDLFK